MSAVESAATGRIVAWVSQRPRGLVLFVSAVAILGVGVVDALTGPDLSVLTFYFLPVLFATWFVSRRAGLVMSGASAAEWLAIDIIANSGHITRGVSIWNTAVHFAFFTGAVWMIGALKESLERHQHEERRRMEKEIETARDVQKALLPSDPEFRIGGFDVAASCEPALGISGDFYDIITVEEDGFLVAVADVSGKGVAAGLLGASLLGGLRNLAPFHRGRVDQLVAQLNATLQKASPAVRYATLFAAEYDATSSRLRWVNAGHATGLIFHTSAPDPTRLRSTGTVVGLFAETKWEQRETPLNPGDTVLLYSDGILEATDGAGTEFGERRIIDAVQPLVTEPARVIHRALLDAVDRFAGGRPLSDDQTIVLLQRRNA